MQSELGKIVSALGGEVTESFAEESDTFYRENRRACVILPSEVRHSSFLILSSLHFGLLTTFRWCSHQREVTPDEDKMVRRKVEMFKSFGVQPVQPIELALAILYRDVATYCNPPLNEPPEPRLVNGKTSRAKLIALDNRDADMEEEEEEGDASLVLIAEVKAEDIRQRTQSEPVPDAQGMPPSSPHCPVTRQLIVPLPHRIISPEKAQARG